MAKIASFFRKHAIFFFFYKLYGTYFVCTGRGALYGECSRGSAFLLGEYYNTFSP